MDVSDSKPIPVRRGALSRGSSCKISRIPFGSTFASSSRVARFYGRAFDELRSGSRALRWPMEQHLPTRPLPRPRRGPPAAVNPTPGSSDRFEGEGHGSRAGAEAGGTVTTRTVPKGCLERPPEHRPSPEGSDQGNRLGRVQSLKDPSRVAAMQSLRGTTLGPFAASRRVAQ